MAAPEGHVAMPDIYFIIKVEEFSKNWYWPQTNQKNLQISCGYILEGKPQC